MIDFKSLKLVIWDLDETLWKGTISEGEVELPKSTRQLLDDLLDSGVMISICSKNDESFIKNYLQKLGIIDYFIFISVNWSSKGDRVKQIITAAQLREINTLFIDDNVANREEVHSICPQCVTADIDIIPQLEKYFKNNSKNDKERKRLKQYHIL